MEALSQEFRLGCQRKMLHSDDLTPQPRKLAKHTQTIRCQQPTNFVSVFDHFVGLALKGLKITDEKLHGLASQLTI